MSDAIVEARASGLQTEGEVAVAMGVNKRTVRKWVAAGLAPRWHGGRKFYDPAEVEAFRNARAMGNLLNTKTKPERARSRPSPRSGGKDGKAKRRRRKAEEPAPVLDVADAQALLAARVAKENALARKHEFDLSVKKRHHIPAADVEQWAATLGAIVRGSLLAMPAKFASRWAAIDDTRELAAEMEHAAREILEQLANALDQGAIADAA